MRTSAQRGAGDHQRHGHAARPGPRRRTRRPPARRSSSPGSAAGCSPGSGRASRRRHGGAHRRRRPWRAARPGGMALADQLRRAGHDVVTGPIVSSRSVVRGATAPPPRRRGRPRRRHGVGVAGRPAARHAIRTRIAIVRVLSDAPGHELFDPRVLRNGLIAYKVLRRIAPVFDTWAAAVAPREVLLAQPRSFCAGVERAIAIVEPGARAARRAGLRAPPDRPQHPCRRATSRRRARSSSQRARRGAARAP